MKLSGEGFRQIRDALLGAFNRGSLRSMVRIELDVDFDHIVTVGPLADQVEELLRWAEREDRVAGLISAARSTNPTNVVLTAAGEAFMAGDFDATGAATPSAQQIDSDPAQRDIGHAGDVVSGKNLRDEQYEIAQNWLDKGSPRMRGFDLAGKNLSGLHFILADLQGANLSAANLHGALLGTADLRDADMTSANLSMALLQEAKLNRAIMRWADLRGTDLYFAFLQGADLREAVLDEVTILASAHYDKATQLPAGFDPQAAGMIRVGE